MADANDRLLIITGASGGIGAATAVAFRDAGWRVVNLSRRPVAIDGVAHIPCDLGRPGFAASLTPVLAAHIAGATAICLLHNAARLENDRTGELQDDAWRRILEINLVAPNALNNIVLPRMGARSSVLYVGSTLSEKAVPNSLSYVTSKHALMGMMRATCQDLIGRGIHTALICPGFTDTPMLREHLGSDAAVLASIAGLSAYKRLIEPGEIAATLLFAAHSPVLNGAVIHANLGQVEH